jgi:hypothetical protein
LPVVPVVVVAVPVVASVTAALARAAGEGAVRTTVAVSLRGTAWRLADAASCGVTPTVAGAEAPAAGAAVWAETLTIASAATTPSEIDLKCWFMVLPLLKDVKTCNCKLDEL